MPDKRRSELVKCGERLFVTEPTQHGHQHTLPATVKRKVHATDSSHKVDAGKLLLCIQLWQILGRGGCRGEG